MDMPSLFGSMVFNEYAMRARLPGEVFRALKTTMSEGSGLDSGIADIVANAMKEWALEKGATHFTHWFQPMTGSTAEKHESFVSPAGDGRAIMEFSGRELVRGESDASSFPSGGLRATFEARGYTVWDTTSYTFVKDGSLYIPTAFCSYSGEALDKKTPLLRSMEALNRQALRILRLFGDDTTKRVAATLGPEQEYFLIDRELYLKRPDLVCTGRTLFGAPPPKGQEMEDHYSCSIKPRVAAFMRDLETELWKLGVYAKTKHNETAPAQHELALIFSTANIACDHNQLTMELLKSVADRHGLACLLHEKPFAGVNGSGKHVNWSMATDSGVNLLEPGETPHRNARFLLFLVATVRAVDEYQELLRISAASASNDHRLGSCEAPPAIISVFLGDELTEILDAIEAGTGYESRRRSRMEIGVSSLPRFPQDSTDRNRTSPVAFTGNKFEFRMPGSSFSVAGPGIVLNTALAQVLQEFADGLETAPDFKTALTELIRKTVSEHKRIIFNGNSYAPEWPEEAARRGLSNLGDSRQALSRFLTPKIVGLYGRHGVFGEEEMRSRLEIRIEAYCNSVRVEAVCMVRLCMADIIPACLAYQNELAELLARKRDLGSFDCTPETDLLTEISAASARMSAALAALETALEKSGGETEPFARLAAHGEEVLPAMADLRRTVDALEVLVARKHWPFPVYAELFYRV
ncbi:MAG: glutamine synthetase III [Treponema sp.]|nr:glutamine synthetase III [Treponema sp.]